MAVEMKDAIELREQKPRKLLCRLFNHRWDLVLEEDGMPPHRRCVRCGLCITLPRGWHDAGKYWYEEAA